MMIWAYQIFIGLIATMLLIQGFLWAFLPESNLVANDIVASIPLGINMIKSDIGAGLFSVGIFSFLFLFRGKQWFLPLIIMILGYLIIRTISFFVDGYHQTVVFGIALETLSLISVLILNRLRSDKHF